MPSIMYDAPILGFSGSQLAKLRREAGVFTGLGGRKRDTDLALSFSPEKDPEVVAAVSVVKRFAREVWAAALPASIRGPANLTLGALASGVSVYLEANKLPPKYVAGPMSSLHQALSRAGWSLVSPLVVRTREGSAFNMTHACPTRITDHFRRDLCTVIQMRGSQKCHLANASDTSADIMDKNVFFSPLRSLYKKLSQPKASLLLALVANGVFTDVD